MSSISKTSQSLVDLVDSESVVFIFYLLSFGFCLGGLLLLQNANGIMLPKYVCYFLARVKKLPIILFIHGCQISLTYKIWKHASVLTSVNYSIITPNHPYISEDVGIQVFWDCWLRYILKFCYNNIRMPTSTSIS